MRATKKIKDRGKFGRIFSSLLALIVIISSFPLQVLAQEIISDESMPVNENGLSRERNSFDVEELEAVDLD